MSDDDASVQRLKLADEDGLETWLDFRTGQLTLAVSPERVGHHERGGITRGPVPKRRRMKSDASLLSVVQGMLESRGFAFHEVNDTTVSLRLRGERAAYEVYLNADDDHRQAHCFMNLPMLAPADRRTATAEAITRANYKMALGGFELDFSDGEVRFHVGVALEDGQLTEKMADQMLGMSVYTCDRFHDALARVMVADADPASEIAAIEL